MSDALQAQAPQSQGATVAAGSSGCSCGKSGLSSQMPGKRDRHHPTSLPARPLTWPRGLAAARSSPVVSASAAPAGRAAARPRPPGAGPRAERRASQPRGSMRPAEGSTRAGRPLPLRRGHRKSAVRASQRDPGRAPRTAQAGFWRPHRLLLGVLPVVGAEPGSVGVPRGARGSGGSWRCGGVPRPGGGVCQQPIGRPPVPRPPGPAAHPEPLLLAVLLPPTSGLTVHLQQPLQSRLLLRRAHARRRPVPARGLGPRGLRGSGGLGTSPPPPEGAREHYGAAQLLLRGARASSQALKRVRIAQQARVPWESCGALPLPGTTSA